MSKIVLIGGNGAVGKELHISGHEVRRTNEYLGDIEEGYLDDVFCDCDYIVSLACSGVRKGMKRWQFFYNLRALQQLLEINDRKYAKHIFVLGSGSEFPRDKPIYAPNEPVGRDVRLVDDYYGRFKQIQSQMCAEEENITNIRVFGLFGFGEAEDRLFPTIMNDGFSSSVVISNNIFFDFFYKKHLYAMIGDLIDAKEAGKPLPETVNASYEKKIKLSEFHALVTKYKKQNTETLFGDSLEVITESQNAYVGQTNEWSRKYDLESGIEQHVKEVIRRANINKK